MAFDLKIEEASPIQRKLTFTLDEGTVSGELDRAFREVGKSARLPGFRQGKIPRKVLEARFGRSIQGEVIEKLINKHWQEAMTDLAVAGRPAVEDQGELKRGKPFTFTIAVEVKPEIDVDNYTGLNVTYPVSPVTDDMVQAGVDRRLQSLVKIEEVTDDRGVEETDFVLTEVSITDGDDVVFVDEPGTMVNMQAERYYPGIEELLLGMKKDEEKEAEINLGASAIDEIAGKTGTANIKVIGIQAQVVPELSDDVAEELGVEGGAEGLKQAVHGDLSERAEEAGRNQARANLLTALVDSNTFEVPSGMIEEQYDALMEELRIRRVYSGQDPRNMRMSDAEVADLRQRAEFAAKASCILMAVARQESIEVEDSDMTNKIEEIAGMRGQAPEAIRGYLEKDEAMDMLSTRILEEKTLEWLLERAELTAEEAKADEPEAKEAAPKKSAKKAKSKAKETETPEKAEAAPATASDDLPSWNKSMKKDELLAAAKARGLSVTTKNTKAQIVEALEGAA